MTRGAPLRRRALRSSPGAVSPWWTPARVALACLLLLEASCSHSVDALFRDDASGTSGAAGSTNPDGGSGGGASGSGPIVTPIESCPVVRGGPSGIEPLPTPAQAAYQRTELTAYMHFGMGTFDDTEYGDASVDTPSLFAPTALDTTAWVRALKGAGFRQAMLVAKHSTGFCLWPSAYTDYSVKNSTWRDGGGDVVREFADAMHAADMRLGFFLSAWDEDYPSSSADYETYLRNQLVELLTQYGPVHEIAWSGFRAPASVDWAGIARLAKELQPNVLVWLGPEIAATGAELRYIGNQIGTSTRSTSSIGDVPNGGPKNVWYPADAPVSDRKGNWFWHPADTVMTLEELQSVYFSSVGKNATLLLNVPPAKTGRFDAQDLALLEQFGTWHSSLYRTNLLEGQPVSADSTWANAGFGAAKATDNDICTYWAAGSGTTSGRVEVTPESPMTISLVSIREPIELGERTTAYHVEFLQDGSWNEAPTDSSGTRIEGTVIGQRQLWTLTPTSVEAMAIVIDSARDVPAIAEFGAY
jgi:alpha-L-fucosidase